VEQPPKLSIVLNVNGLTSFLFFCRCFDSLEFNHIQVVEWHVMSVTAKHIHVTSSVDNGGVTVTGIGASTLNEAGLFGTIV